MRISDWSSDVCSSDLCSSYLHDLPRSFGSQARGAPRMCYGSNVRLFNWHGHTFCHVYHDPDGTHGMRRLFCRTAFARRIRSQVAVVVGETHPATEGNPIAVPERKSTRLNSSH